MFQAFVSTYMSVRTDM